jgi:hypothetical protein
VRAHVRISLLSSHTLHLYALLFSLAFFSTLSMIFNFEFMIDGGTRIKDFVCLLGSFFFSLAPFAQPDDADMPTFAIG